MNSEMIKEEKSREITSVNRTSFARSLTARSNSNKSAKFHAPVVSKRVLTEPEFSSSNSELEEDMEEEEDAPYAARLPQLNLNMRVV